MFVFEDLNKKITAASGHPEESQRDLPWLSDGKRTQWTYPQENVLTASEMLQEDMETMGPVKLSDVEIAQQNIVR
jgi:hypothetical protein